MVINFEDMFGLVRMSNMEIDDARERGNLQSAVPYIGNFGQLKTPWPVRTTRRGVT